MEEWLIGLLARGFYRGMREGKRLRDADAAAGHPVRGPIFPRRTRQVDRDAWKIPHRAITGQDPPDF